jgi:hypothetical protein
MRKLLVLFVSVTSGDLASSTFRSSLRLARSAWLCFLPLALQFSPCCPFATACFCIIIFVLRLLNLMASKGPCKQSPTFFVLMQLLLPAVDPTITQCHYILALRVYAKPQRQTTRLKVGKGQRPLQSPNHLQEGVVHLKPLRQRVFKN